MCHIWDLSKSDFKWLLWPWEWCQGHIDGMSWKALSKGIVWYMNCRLICKTLWNTAISTPHWFTLERWTLAYKAVVKGHSAPILWLQGAIDLRCSRARLEGSRSIGVKTCHPSVYGRTDEQTNGRQSMVITKALRPLVSKAKKVARYSILVPTFVCFFKRKDNLLYLLAH